MLLTMSMWRLALSFATGPRARGHCWSRGRFRQLRQRQRGHHDPEGRTDGGPGALHVASPLRGALQFDAVLDPTAGGCCAHARRQHRSLTQYGSHRKWEHLDGRLRLLTLSRSSRSVSKSSRSDSVPPGGDSSGAPATAGISPDATGARHARRGPFLAVRPACSSRASSLLRCSPRGPQPGRCDALYRPVPGSAHRAGTVARMGRGPAGSGGDRARAKIARRLLEDRIPAVDHELVAGVEGERGSQR